MDENIIFSNNMDYINNTKTANCECLLQENVEFAASDDYKNVNIVSTLSCGGKILKVIVKLNNICKNRKIAIGVIIYEKDRILAFKVSKVDPTEGTIARENEEKEFWFALPDENANQKRNLAINVFAHYYDFSVF
ncbi:MAG: hypothetical protein ACERKV_02120 [Clostridiaceae bacterium]